jgi:hypothetical protein
MFNRSWDLFKIIHLNKVKKSPVFFCISDAQYVMRTFSCIEVYHKIYLKSWNWSNLTCVQDCKI